MEEALICIGCGATLQSTTQSQSGYLPASALKKAQAEVDDDLEVYCQRCFRLRHYNEIMPVEQDNDSFLALLNTLSAKQALIVNVVDLFDFSNSLLAAMKRFVGQNDFILVGNKVDLFPKNSREVKIKDWMRQEANRQGLFPKKIFLISAAKRRGLDELITYLAQASRRQDVYFVGTTNVGKSTLINAIVDQMGEVKDLITTSRFPGTTLDQIKIPLANGHFLIDTPGVLTHNQLGTKLSADNLNLISPRKTLKPVTYQLLPGNTLFLGGLGRVDYLKGPDSSFTVYASRSLFIHRTKTINADDFYEKHRGGLLRPALMGPDAPALKGQEFVSQDKSDLLVGGIGFVTIPAGCVVKSYTPAGIGLGIRRALI